MVINKCVDEDQLNLPRSRVFSLYELHDIIKLLNLGRTRLAVAITAHRAMTKSNATFGGHGYVGVAGEGKIERISGSGGKEVEASPDVTHPFAALVTRHHHL